MKHPKREQIKVPRLCKEIKEMNGKSTKRLTECIDRLSDLLDEKTTDKPDTLRDTE